MTRQGMQPIKSLTTAHHVWSKDADTGKLGWKLIEAQYANPYTETVSVAITDVAHQRQQTIVSNRIHPYFIQSTRSLTHSSEGHHYDGEIAHGHWVDAGDLQAGDKLLNADGSWSQVDTVSITQAPLQAYNLTVSGYHTYFVAGSLSAKPVWVHNDCFDQLVRDLGLSKDSLSRSFSRFKVDGRHFKFGSHHTE